MTLNQFERAGQLLHGDDQHWRDRFRYDLGVSEQVFQRWRTGVQIPEDFVDQVRAELEARCAEITALLDELR